MEFSGARIGTAGKVWDLRHVARNSAAERRMAPSYHVIFSAPGSSRFFYEYENDIRHVYEIDSAACRWWGKEGRQMGLRPDTCPASNVFGGTAVCTEFSGKGDYCGKKYSAAGGYECSEPRKGVILVGEDTIPAELRTETISYSIFADTCPDETYRETTHRWFVSGNRLPVAFQREVTATTPSGSRVLRTTPLFTMNFEGLDSEEIKNNDEELKNLLASATVAVEGNRLRIMVPSDKPVTLGIGISTVSGIPYQNTEVEMSQTAPVEIDISTLPPGQYVAGLQSGTAHHKHYFMRH